MWHRFGTPTKRAESGTDEEFQRALKRFKESPDSLQIMIYFKNASVPMSDIDPEQIGKVNVFKSDIQKLGLYSEFQSTDEFKENVEIHLSRKVQEWNRQGALSEQTREVVSNENTSLEGEIIGNVEVEDEEGVLDLLDQFEVQSELIISLAGEISSLMEFLGDKISSNAAEINAATVASGGSLPRKTGKILLSKAADNMNIFADQMASKIKPFRKANSDGLGSFVKAINISANDSIDYGSQEDFRDIYQVVVHLENSIHDSEEAVVMFRNTVLNLPRLTTTLNKAKRNVVSVLDQLIIDIHRSKELSSQALSILEEKIGPINQDFISLKSPKVAMEKPEYEDKVLFLVDDSGQKRGAFCPDCYNNNGGEQRSLKGPKRECPSCGAIFGYTKRDHQILNDRAKRVSQANSNKPKQNPAGW